MSASAQLTVTAYAVLAASVLLLGVAGSRRPTEVASIGRVLTWALRRRPTQLVVVFVWWWLGWHLVTAR
ncbi:MAG: DUF6186 family protein [Nocardioides sp.]